MKMDTVNNLYKNCQNLAYKYLSLDENDDECRRNCFRTLREISENSKKMVQIIANSVNSFGAKDLDNLGIDLKILPNLFYIYLYAINFVDTDYGYFSNDGRSQHSAEFAQILIKDEGYGGHFGRKDSWLNNENILKALSDGVRETHKTLIQSSVRCILETLRKHQNEMSDVWTREQKVFVEKAINYVYSGVNGRHVYLPFI